MGDFRERLAMQWDRLQVIGFIPLGELTLMDLASLVALFYVVGYLPYRFVIMLMDDHQRRRDWKKATKDED